MVLDASLRKTWILISSELFFLGVRVYHSAESNKRLGL
jgi:hypothetical protein